MGPGVPDGQLLRYIVPLGVVALVVILRNSRPRALKIDRLWLLPVIYLLLLASSLYAAPPPLTLLSLAILVGCALAGGAIGWQRGRFTQVHIHPQTQELTSRASPTGIAFIFGILLVRYAARDVLAANAASLHLPIVAITDGFLVLAVFMLSVQRLEVWMRASRMLAEAKAASGPPPPTSIVS